jgi:hypothetical protein
MRYDDRWGVEPGETTHVHAAELYRTEFRTAHPESEPVSLTFQDLFTLATMDLLNQRYAESGAAQLGRRVPLIHALRDVGAGRWLPRDRTGHIFLNTNTSLGMEATAGFEALKTSICLGAELVPSPSGASSPPPSEEAGSTAAEPFAFVKPWAPSKPLYVERLKRWAQDDARELSLARDLRATLNAQERLGVGGPDAETLEQSFTALADVGYAGYCYHDFAGVSMDALLDVYQGISREYVGDPAFKAVYRWLWLDELFDEKGSGEHGNTGILLKNPAESTENATLFGVWQHFDTKFGAPETDTQSYLENSIAQEFASYHPGARVSAVDCRELTILAMMDLIDMTDPDPAYRQLPRRIPYARGFHDNPVGRVFPRDMIGRIWFNYDTSVGLEPDAGMDHPRFGFALGARS